MKPDLLVCWIKHTDYPLFRAVLKKHRDFFGRIVIYFNENNRFPYLDHFMHSAMQDLGDIVFLDQSNMEWGKEDWRNVATNEMLKHSTSEWVCSVEQDWMARDWNKLLGTVSEAMKQSDMTGWYNKTNASYFHPAFWFIKRELLEKTSKDFSAHPEIDGSDHFGTITYDAQKLGAKLLPIQDLGFNCEPIPEADAFHQGGINQNYLDFEQRMETNSIHRPEAFYVYNYYSMKAPVTQSSKFQAIMEWVDVSMRMSYQDPEESPWAPFFKWQENQ